MVICLKQPISHTVNFVDPVLVSRLQEKTFGTMLEDTLATGEKIEEVLSTLSLKGKAEYSAYQKEVWRPKRN